MAIRFLVFTEVETPILVLWVVTPCILVAEYRRFGLMYFIFSVKVIQVLEVVHCIKNRLSLRDLRCSEILRSVEW
jgi:hypothetical protein